MKLYLVHRCPFGHRASIALQEKKLPFELAFFQPAKRPPELEAVGPFAKSPTLFDGEARVHDSQVVLEYLEDRYPEPRLLPESAAGRAAVRMIVTRISEDLLPKFGNVAREALFTTPRDEAKVEGAVQAFLAQLATWDQRLAERPFAAGDELTLADIVLYTMFPALRGMAGVAVPESRPNVRAWVDRMDARPTTKLPEPAVSSQG